MKPSEVIRGAHKINIGGKILADNIKISIVMANEAASANISQWLINLGIPASTFQTPETLLTAVSQNQSDKIHFIMADIDFNENRTLTMLEELKKSDIEFFTIGTSFNATAELITTLKNYNLISFIMKPVTIDILRDKFNIITSRFKDHFPERQHIRIKPDENEYLRANFILTNGKRISSKILDISLGGIAVEMYTDYEDPELANNSVIKKLSFNLGVKDIEVDVTVVKKVAKFISFKFSAFYGTGQEGLTKYILKKLSVE